MNKFIFAHYFTWFRTAGVSGLWSHWNWKGKGVEHNPDRMVDPHRRDIASVFYPSVQPYDSSSAHIMKYHIRLARAALIDAFCVDWYGPAQGKRCREDTVDNNFGQLLEAALGNSFSACICYEEKILTQALVPENLEEPVRIGKEHIRYISEKYFSRESYWKIGGRPVLVVWGNHCLSAEAWREILSAAHPWNPVVLYSYHSPLLQDILKSKELIDGFYPWMNISALDGQKKDLEEFYQFEKESIASGRTNLLCAGVWPGFNDSGVHGWGNGNRIIPDPTDKLYELCWDMALKNNPDIVSIATWNDWNEGSVIEPSLELGCKRLEQTRAYAQKFKKLAPVPYNFGAVAKEFLQTAPSS